MIHSLLSRHRLNPNAGDGEASNVFIHPSALLIAVVGVAFFKTPEDAEAKVRVGQESHNPLSAEKTKAIAKKVLDAAVIALASVSEKNTNVYLAEQDASLSELVTLVIASLTSVTANKDNKEFYEITSAFSSHQAMDGELQGEVFFVDTKDLDQDYSRLTSHIQKYNNQIGLQSAPSDQLIDFFNISTFLDLVSSDDITFLPAPGMATNIETLGVQSSPIDQGNKFYSPVMMQALMSLENNNNIFQAKAAQYSAVAVTDGAGSIKQYDGALSSIKSFIPITFVSDTMIKDVGRLVYQITMVAQSGSASAYLALNDIKIYSNGEVNGELSVSASSGMQTGSIVTAEVYDDSVNFEHRNDNSEIPVYQAELTTIANVSNVTQNSGANINSQIAEHEVAPTKPALTYTLNSAAFAAALENFINGTPNLQVSIISEQYLFGGASTLPNNPYTLGEVLLRFPDGSSIGIIGTRSQIDDLLSDITYT